MSAQEISKDGPLAVYVHWPYCARICPYCDFNVYKARADAELLPAILSDLARQRELTGMRRVSSVHFGGGTPSLMSPADLGAVIETVDALWGLGGVEIALEANPSFLDRAKIIGFRNAGVNRLSLGVQSFDDEGLHKLGRDHDGATARAVAEVALGEIPNTSLDLIFGWVGQGMTSWTRDVEAVLTLEPSHVSTYQLTIEPGTAFAKAVGRGEVRSVAGDRSADMYELAAERLSAAGYAHYEVSNFAKEGARSQHNLAYWRGWDYVGVGPGAHGRIATAKGRLATVTALRPDEYAAGKEMSVEVMDREAVISERVLMGLRTDEGVAGHEVGGWPDLSDLAEYIEMRGERAVATPRGRRVLDHLTREIISRMEEED